MKRCADAHRVPTRGAHRRVGHVSAPRPPTAEARDAGTPAAVLRQYAVTANTWGVDRHDDPRGARQHTTPRRARGIRTNARADRTSRDTAPRRAARITERAAGDNAHGPPDAAQDRSTRTPACRAAIAQRHQITSVVEPYRPGVPRLRRYVYPLLHLVSSPSLPSLSPVSSPSLPPLEPPHCSRRFVYFPPLTDGTATHTLFPHAQLLDCCSTTGRQSYTHRRAYALVRYRLFPLRHHSLALIRS